MIALTIALAAASPQALPQSLNSIFAAIDQPGTPGCSVDVRQRGKPGQQRVFGMANLETPAPITAASVFEAGSVSKQFIASGAALLATRGKLSLDDSVTRWLPELPPLYAPVTLRMMLNHTSGIRSWNNLAELTGTGEDSTGYDNGWVLRAVARQTRLNNVPGAEYLYSNSNFVLAATVVERAAREPLNVFFQNAFFARLGMKQTQWRTDFRSIVPNRAQAYAVEGKGWRLDMPFNNVVGAGGLMTTTNDLQRWNAALADPVATDRAWVAMLSVPGRLNDGTRTRYGLGLELGVIAGAEALSHSGSTASYRAWLGRFPASGLSIALLCNAGSLNTEDLGPEVAALFLPAVVNSAATLLVGSPPIGVAKIYRNVANDAVVIATDDQGGVRFNGGGRFVATAPNVLSLGDGTRTAKIKRDRIGSVITVTLGRVGNTPLRLVKTQAWTPTIVELQQLAGRYRSPEIDGTQTIKLVGTQLSWIDPAKTAHPLMPVYRDTFEATGSGWTLRFRRGRSGGFTALDFSITRARQIEFRRISS